MTSLTGGSTRSGSYGSGSRSLRLVHRLTKAQARRIAVRAQLLDAPRPTDLLAVVRQLTLLQIDPTAAIAPSADLVAWSRLGSSYRPDDLRKALEQDRTLFELNALVRPMSDLGLHLARSRTSRSHERTDQWIRDNDRFRRDILKLLRKSGPLSSRDIPDTSVVPWASTGWTNDRNVTQMLEFLIMRGEVAIAGRAGRERLWDLPERVYPDVVVPSVEDAQRIRNERRLASLGIARKKTTAMPLEPVDVGDAGEPAVVEGVKGEWRVDPAALGDDFEGRTALLSPFDRLVYDRRPRAGAVRVRVHARDVQARGEAPLGLLRPPGALRRPSGREGRRHRRPQGFRLAGARGPRGRQVHARHDEVSGGRVGGPGLVARARYGGDQTYGVVVVTTLKPSRSRIGLLSLDASTSRKRKPRSAARLARCATVAR